MADNSEEVPTVETVRELRERVRSLEAELITMRFFAGKHNVDELAQRADAAASVLSPEVGCRVQIVNQGSRYNWKDFEKVGTFSSYKGGWVDSVANGDFGVIVTKAPHFKKAGLEVFLINMDNGKGAVMSRKGIQPILYIGAPVTIVNQACRYVTKHFKDKDGYTDLKFAEEVEQGRKGVLVRTVPHFKVKTNLCHVVCVDEYQRCVVMAGKGLVPLEVPGLSDKIQECRAARCAKEKAAAEKRAAEGGAPSPKRPRLAKDESANSPGSTSPRKSGANSPVSRSPKKSPVKSGNQTSPKKA